MNDSNCVELARLSAARLGIRDTKRGAEGPVLEFSRVELRDLLDRVKQGELDH
jgi:hypothetical protein